LKTLTPVTSLGSRSGVNWIRLNPTPRVRAIALASTVLPDARHVLQQDVAAAEQGNQHQQHLVPLADHHPLDVLDRRPGNLLHDLGVPVHAEGRLLENVKTALPAGV
jgi:hypothetical protein